MKANIPEVMALVHTQSDSHIQIQGMQTIWALTGVILKQQDQEKNEEQILTKQELSGLCGALYQICYNSENDTKDNVTETGLECSLFPMDTFKRHLNMER